MPEQPAITRVVNGARKGMLKSRRKSGFGCKRWRYGPVEKVISGCNVGTGAEDQDVFSADSALSDTVTA